MFMSNFRARFDSARSSGEDQIGIVVCRYHVDDSTAISCSSTGRTHAFESALASFVVLQYCMIASKTRLLAVSKVKHDKSALASDRTGDTSRLSRYLNVVRRSSDNRCTFYRAPANLLITYLKPRGQASGQVHNSEMRVCGRMVDTSSGYNKSAPQSPAVPCLSADVKESLPKQQAFLRLREQTFDGETGSLEREARNALILLAAQHPSDAAVKLSGKSSPTTERPHLRRC